MQEKFKKTFKKVAAIGTGIAMLGMTLTGAMAVDLSNYPSGLGFGGSDTIVVVGANAGDSASDNAAAVDVAAGLPSSGTTSSNSAVLVEGGVDDEVPIGYNICAKNHLDCQMTQDDLETLQETKINFKSSDYDIHDELDLSQKYNVSLVSSLGSAYVGSGVEDNYESNVYLEVGSQNAIRYFYAFDDAIQVNLTSATDTLKIKFLGKTLKITSVPANYDNKFSAYVGNEYFLNQGESVVADGKTVTLDNVGSGGAIAVSVDGVKEVISSGNTETVNGIEITNDETFYTSAGKAETAASLVIGKDASDTFKDGDFYPGGNDICSNNDPEDPDCWKWIISGVGNAWNAESTAITNPTNGSDVTTSGPIIGIGNKFTINDDSDNPPGIGDCLSLPNNYVSICLDSLTVADTDYMNLKVTYESSADFTDVYPYLNGVPAIKVTTSEEEGMKLVSGGFGTSMQTNLTKDTKTDVVYFYATANPTGDVITGVQVFYENSDNQIRYAGNITSQNATLNAIELNYKDTKSTNVILRLTGNTSTANGLNLSLVVSGDDASDLVANSDNINIQLAHTAAGRFSGLGTLANSEEGQELVWSGTVPSTTLGTKDEDHRSLYGIIIRDPKSHGSSDEVELDIPGDQVFGKVIVSGTVVSKADDGSSTTSSAVKLDSEVSDVTAYNVVLVGGPCANSLTAQLMGTSAAYPACAEGFTDGESIIELKANGDKYAIIAAGYSAQDTRRAGVVLKNYADKLGNNVATKNSVTVTGTSLEASGIIVA